MSELLLKCPFCGGEAATRLIVQGAFVRCTECGVTQRSHENSMEAAAAWNRRALEPLSVLGNIEGNGVSQSQPGCDGERAASVGSERSGAHSDWHLCCEPTEEMLAAGYIDADGERQDLTPDEMRSIWFRMHAAIRRDA